MEKVKINGCDFDEFVYSKRDHFEKFRRFGDYANLDFDSCDLKPYQDLLVYNSITSNLEPGSKILEIGGGYSRVLSAIKSDYECWNIDKLEGLETELETVKANTDNRLVIDYMGNFSSELPNNYFDCVFSIGTLSQVPEDEETFQNICRDINRVLKVGGLSLHLFDIILKKEGQWCNKIMSFIQGKIKNVESPIVPLEDLTLDPDLYVMSASAYQEKWQSWTKKDYDTFGMPSSYHVMWRWGMGVASEKSNILQKLALSEEKLQSTEIIENQPETAAKYLKIGHQYQQAEKLEEAATAYQKAIDINPNFSWAYHNLAEVLVIQGKTKEAITYYQEAIGVNPEFALSYYGLGKVFAKQYNLDEAIASFITAIKLQPDYDEFYTSLADTLNERGNLEESQIIYGLGAMLREKSK